jgi:hypothetical protein
MIITAMNPKNITEIILLIRLLLSKSIHSQLSGKIKNDNNSFRKIINLAIQIVSGFGLSF